MVTFTRLLTLKPDLVVVMLTDIKHDRHNSSWTDSNFTVVGSSSIFGRVSADLCGYGCIPNTATYIAGWNGDDSCVHTTGGSKCNRQPNNAGYGLCTSP